MNIPSNCWNISHLLSTFRAAEKPSVNIPQLSLRPGELPSTFVNLRSAGRLSFNYRLLFVRQGYLPSTSINFLWCPKALNEHFVQPVDFCQLFSIFCAVRDLPCTSVNTVRPGDRPSNFVNYPYGGRPSFTFRQHFAWPGNHPLTSNHFPRGRETFHQLLSPFRAAGSPSVKFDQLSVGDFRQPLATFWKARRPSVNLL